VVVQVQVQVQVQVEEACVFFRTQTLRVCMHYARSSTAEISATCCSSTLPTRKKEEGGTRKEYSLCLAVGSPYAGVIPINSTCVNCTQRRSSLPQQKGRHALDGTIISICRQTRSP
jgi:hypothetical protein